MKEVMEDKFKSLSLDVMKESNSSFLGLAKEVLGKYQTSAEKDLEGKKKEIEGVLNPVKETLKKLEEQNREIEKRREGAYSSLNKQIEQLMMSERNLKAETANLVKALKSPNIRGSWGQVHLRRVVELAGLLNRCDFFEQSFNETDGRLLRPDLLVRLPGDRQIVVDAKAPLEAFLDAVECEDEERKTRKLLDHAAHVKRHVKSLASKEYWKQFQPSPEYVILFLPAEAFFSAAIQADPSIIEMGMDQNVIIATPTTLIAILKAVAFGWRQEKVSQDAAKIAQMGQELYDRLLTMNDHWSKVGRGLSQSIDAYNQATASMESRVLVTARKFKDSSMGKEIKEIDLIEKTHRELLVKE